MFALLQHSLCLSVLESSLACFESFQLRISEMSTAEKSSQSSSSLNNTNDDESRESKQTLQSDQYLKQINRASHKISKPIRRTPLEHHHQLQPQDPPQQQQQQLVQQQQQHQPPVYNINRSDFRDVVQKLTGSPAHHDPLSSPPPIHPPKPPNSRLHRIRPPPLPNLSSNTTRSATTANPINPTNPNNTLFAINNNDNSNNGGRPVAGPPPLSPLPPLPSVHVAAESPITAYMRYLRSSTMPSMDSESKRVSGFSPRWGIGNPEMIQQQSQQLMLPLPSSPFGGLGSVISPSLLLSPSSAQLGIPQLAPPLSPSRRNL